MGAFVFDHRGHCAGGDREVGVEGKGEGRQEYKTPAVRARRPGWRTLELKTL